MQNAGEVEAVKDSAVVEAAADDPLLSQINWNDWDNFGPWWNEQSSRVQNIKPVAAVLGQIGSLNNCTVNISIGNLNN